MQSIYGFRGADFENIHHFKERVPDAEVLIAGNELSFLPRHSGFIQLVIGTKPD